MDPSTGRFITMDPYAGSIFDPATLHKYLYCNANPVMYSDPSGYMFDLAVAGYCSATIDQAQAQYDYAAVKIGMELINSLKSIVKIYSYELKLLALISAKACSDAIWNDWIRDTLIDETLENTNIEFAKAGDGIGEHTNGKSWNKHTNLRAGRSTTKNRNKNNFKPRTDKKKRNNPSFSIIESWIQDKLFEDRDDE